MNKVLIMGSPGAGKSTLARTLGDMLQIPVYHLDALYWKPGWVESSVDEFKKKHQKIIENDQWIIDGNYGSTMDLRIQLADTLIYLDVPRTICLYRVLKRRFQYRNQSRPDIGKDCPEKLDLPFILWIWQYPKNKRPPIVRKLQDHSQQKQIMILRSHKEVDAFIENIHKQT